MSEREVVDQKVEQESNRVHESFLVPFFKGMNENFDGNWCVLHSYDTLPFYSESDVDMAFSGCDLEELERLILRTALNTGWQLYQKLWYDVMWCCYYVLREKTSGNLLAIDFLTDTLGIGRYGFKTTTLTANCNQVKGQIPVPNHETALSYKLVKRIEKGRSLAEDEDYLKAHFKASDERAMESFLEEQYGTKGKAKLLSYLRNKGDTPTDSELRFLKKERKRRTSKLDLRAKYAYWETRRLAYRIAHPSGMLIYIPQIGKERQKSFTRILEEKVGILFRFVESDTRHSSITLLKAMAGSALVVRETSKFDSKKAVQYQWPYPKYIPFDSADVPNFSDLSMATESYLKLILKALAVRIPSKLHLHA